MMICLDLISLKGSQFYLHLHFYISKFIYYDKSHLELS